jgi:hypothetical protein
MTIRYEGNNRVNQHIETLSLYEFEGDINDVLKTLTEKKEYLEEKYGKKGMTLTEKDYRGGAYADGTSQKKVTFDKFWLDKSEEYGDVVYFVWGERNLLPEETEALDKKNAKAKEDRLQRDKEQYEKLKKQFEG